MIMKAESQRTYFFTPNDLFFNLRALLLQDLHLVADIGFLNPQCIHIFEKSLLFWAICFLTTSVIGITHPIQITSLLSFSQIPII